MQFLHHHEKVIDMSDILQVGRLALWMIQQCMHDCLLESLHSTDIITSTNT